MTKKNSNTSYTGMTNEAMDLTQPTSKPARNWKYMIGAFLLFELLLLMLLPQRNVSIYGRSFRGDSRNLEPTCPEVD